MRSYTFLGLFLMVFLGLGIGCYPHHATNPDESTAGVGQAEHQAMNVQAANNVDGQDAGRMHGGDRQQRMMEMCPMQVDGTTRQLVKLDDAVAMDFTTTGDVDALRQRVEKMAEMRGQMHGEGGMMHGEHGHMQHGRKDGQGQHGKMTDEQRQMRGQMMQMMSNATVETESIDGGMRVVFTPRETGQVDRLYEMMERHSEMMGEQGACPMM